VKRLLHTEDKGQSRVEVVIIEQLVRLDHLLRKVQKYVDFRFIVDKVRHLYSPDNGRPSLDPVVLFKMLFIGYLFGIRSERRLVQEIADNVAYRWFLGLGLTDPAPSASVIWANRRRRWKDSEVCQEIFDEIVRQAVLHGLVDGKVLYSDSTHIKANANKKRFLVRAVPQSTRHYVAELEAAIELDRAEHGKKPLRGRKGVAQKSREVKVSTTDPESGYLMREGKPECFAYSEHRTVDGCYSIVTDVHVTAATVHDSVPYTGRIERQRSAYGFAVQKVALDAGYLTAWNAHWLETQGIYAVIAHRRFQSVRTMLPKSKFHYDAAQDVYHCPGASTLTYRTTNREGFREYRSDPQTCRNCLLRPYCTQSRTAMKTITRHVWEDTRERLRERRLSPAGRELYKYRKETIERSFADAKELHGLRYARMRGLARVREQCLLTAAAQNIKKLATVLDRRHRRAQSA
jgi:transposase